MSRADERKAVRRVLLSSFHGRGRELRRVAAWSAVEALPAFLSGRLVAQAIDHGFLAHDTATGFAWLGALGVSVVIGAWGTRKTYLLLARLVEPFRDDLARMAVTGALRRSTAPGARPDTAAVARLTQQVEIVRESYASVLLVVQGFVVTTVGAVLGLLTLSPAFLVLVLPPLLLGLGLFLSALPRMAKRQRASILADEGIGESTSVLADGLRDVTAAGAEDTVASAVGRHIDEQARATTELARFTAVRTVAVALGGWLPLVLILAAGPWLLRHGETTGTLLGALTYVTQGVHAAVQTLVGGLGSTGLWLLVTMRRIVEAADAAPDPPSDRYRGRPRARGQHLRLRGVTFGYGRSPEPVIRELDLDVPDGDHLTIVGPSGVGKSTLANLITGILRPQRGEVTLGGLPVHELDPRDLADHRVLIPQEAYVFAGTVWENLTYLRSGAATLQVDDAVERLGARQLVERVGGYRAELDTQMLSAGERQLLTLVRAYLAPAGLVVLDEATCHLDPAAEVQIEEAFAGRHGTLIVIAHRISSALRGHRILVLDGSQVLLGSHDELLARSGLYRDLVGHWESGLGLAQRLAPERLAPPPAQPEALWALLRERTREALRHPFTRR